MNPLTNRNQIIYNNVNQFLLSSDNYNNNLIIIKYNINTDLQPLFNNFPVNVLNKFTSGNPTNIITYNLTFNEIDKYPFSTFINNNGYYDFSSEYNYLNDTYLNNLDNCYFIINFYNSNSKILLCSNNVFNYLKNNM